MYMDVFMSGFGGQGVLLAGNLLAYAAIREGKKASFFPAYGVEKRGGAASCTVVVTDGEVESPVIGNPGSALIFNQLSMDKFFSKVRPGGFCLVNTSLVEGDAVSQRSDIETLAIPASELAVEIGDARLVNMVALGAFVARSGVVSLDNLKESLKDVLPERNHRFIPMNIKAIDCGADFSRKAK